MTIYDKIKDNPDEKIPLLSDKELLQYMLEATHNKNAEPKATKLISQYKSLAGIFPHLNTLLEQKIINEDFYFSLKISKLLGNKQKS